jgi:hypothetical protein
MNYKKVANSIAHAFATDDVGSFDLAGSIEQALRRAANEAAWDGLYTAWLDDLDGVGFPKFYEDAIEAKYGPRPKGEPR